MLSLHASVAERRLRVDVYIWRVSLRYSGADSLDLGMIMIKLKCLNHAPGSW